MRKADVLKLPSMADGSPGYPARPYRFLICRINRVNENFPVNL